MIAIKAVDLTKRFGDVYAVRGLNLDIFEGELFSLLGVNGAGKTTTVKMLSCLCKPSDGDGFVLGKSILTDSNDIKRDIAVSPQETAIAPNLSVKENLELICGICGFSKNMTEQKIVDASREFKLGNILNKKAGKLSGGWQRRLSIAMALISEPKVLFLDEPTLGLDVIARSELWDIIRALRGKTTVILTTHYMEEAEALSDRVGIMKDGKLLFVGSPLELINKTGEERFENAFISVVKEAEG